VSSGWSAGVLPSAPGAPPVQSGIVGCARAIIGAAAGVVADVGVGVGVGAGAGAEVPPHASSAASVARAAAERSRM
jgi:hypothetical protein